MSPFVADAVGTLKTIVNSFPEDIDFTAIDRSTLSTVADGGLMVKGRKSDWPVETFETFRSHTGVFAASVTGEVSWA